MILNTLKSATDFATAQKRGKRFVRDNIVVLVHTSGEASNENCSRVGYVVSKKCGNAVHRNRIKRRLRASVRQVFGNVDSDSQNSKDYVIIGRHKAYDCPFAELTDNLQDILLKEEQS